jgi:hypothetical protein
MQSDLWRFLVASDAWIERHEHPHCRTFIASMPAAVAGRAVVSPRNVARVSQFAIQQPPPKLMDVLASSGTPQNPEDENLGR